MIYYIKQNIKQNYKPFLLCYLPIIIFFAIVQNFIDRSFVIVILMLLIMSFTLFCVVMEKYNNYHSTTMFSLSATILWQFFIASSSMCDYIFLFFALCVFFAVGNILQSNYKSKLDN
jgi:hypothetical protein